MGRRLGQHFLRRAVGRAAARASSPRGPTSRSSRSAPARARSPCPLAARARAGHRGRARPAPRRRACASARPPTCTVVQRRRARGGPRARSSRAGSAPRRQPALLRLEPAAAPLPRPARPRARRARDAAGGGRAAGRRRRPGSKEYGILSVLYGLWADVDIPLRFPPGRFEPPPKVSLRRAPRPLPGPAPGGRRPTRRPSRRLVQRAFAHRRRTLENNLQDSYPNLKEHLRLLNIEGSRRAETLSVVEFAQARQGPWSARTMRHEAPRCSDRLVGMTTARCASSRSAGWASSA